MKMEKDFPGFYEEYDKDFVIKSMKKYIYEKQEMDKQLENLIRPIIKDKKCDVLDACCGIGHISYHLSELSPNSSFLGVDLTPFLIEEGKKICQDKKNITLENADINQLKNKYSKKFDISIAWKAISWMPNYDEFLKSLMSMTKGHIFLNSPFYDGDIDFIRVKAVDADVATRTPSKPHTSDIFIKQKDGSMTLPDMFSKNPM